MCIRYLFDVNSKPSKGVQWGITKIVEKAREIEEVCKQHFGFDEVQTGLLTLSIRVSILIKKKEYCICK